LPPFPEVEEEDEPEQKSFIGRVGAVIRARLARRQQPPPTPSPAPEPPVGAAPPGDEEKG